MVSGQTAWQEGWINRMCAPDSDIASTKGIDWCICMWATTDIINEVLG